MMESQRYRETHFGNVVIVHFLQNYHTSTKIKTILEITLLQTSPQTMKDG